MKTIDTLAELDLKIREAAEALKVSDDEMRKVFMSFNMAYPKDMPPDPWSPEYRQYQMSLYEKIAGHTYSKDNEATGFDVEGASSRPFPFYTGSTGTVSDHLALIAKAIHLLEIPPPAKILEFGPGWGNTTLMLAQMGYDITAIDVEKNFVDLVARRAERLGLNIDARVGNFFDVETIEEVYDAALFFECFHHCDDHARLLKGLSERVRPGGQVLFAAEPILSDFPAPWGMRMDGESLWAIRNNGWMELGFNEDYFVETIERLGWSITKHQCLDVPWAGFFSARLPLREPTIIEGTDPRLKSEWGSRSSKGLRVGIGDGYFSYGPYISLPAGRWLVEAEYEVNCEGRLKVEIAGGDGKIFTMSEMFPLSKESKTLKVKLYFSTGRLIKGFEVRTIASIVKGSATLKRLSMTPS